MNLSTIVLNYWFRCRNTLSIDCHANWIARDHCNIRSKLDCNWSHLCTVMIAVSCRRGAVPNCGDSMRDAAQHCRHDNTHADDDDG